jgi:hypothetical protein
MTSTTKIAETPDFVIVDAEAEHFDFSKKAVVRPTTISKKRKVWTAVLMLIASVAGFAGAYALDSLNDVRSTTLQQPPQIAISSSTSK